MTQPTKQQWEGIKRELSAPGGAVFLRCDDYLIAAEVKLSKMKLVIMVYVNGWFKGKDVWSGKESKIGEIGDIARRFYCLHRMNRPAKEIAINIRIFGKKACRENGCNEARLYTSPEFRAPGSFIAHLKKHNPSIEVLDLDAYVLATAMLPKEIENAAQ